MQHVIWINGKPVRPEEAKISVLDHGMLYGDGVFEGIRVYNRHVFKLDEHLTRLYESAALLGIKIDINQAQFREEVLNAGKTSPWPSSYLRITVSREGTMGLHTFPEMKINRVLIFMPFDYQSTETYEKGMHLKSVSRFRTPNSVFPMWCKSLNYLNSILAANEAIAKGADDAIMTNPDGWVCESSGSNVFFIKGNTLVTPPKEAGILMGVTRAVIMEIASKQGYSVEERLFRLDELERADEAFLTGTAMELMPVTKINDKTIGDGKASKTRKLMELFRQYTKDVPGPNLD